MNTFLLLLLALNAAYFAFVAYLSYRAVKRNDPETRGYLLRLSWLEFTTGFRLPAFNVALGGYFDPRVQVQIYWIYGSLFLKLPIKTRYDECFPPSYGVSLTDINGDGWQQIHWHWGRKTAIWDMPWTFQWHSTSYLFLQEGSDWATEWKTEQKGGPKIDTWKDEVKARLYRTTHPYLYVLKDGTAQHRYATITYTTRDWRRKWLPFTSLFGLHRPTIDVDFDQEVGERAGSWKGGTTGCNYNLRPYESGGAALRRMEAERKFN